MLRIVLVVLLAQVALPLVAQEKTKEAEFRGQDPRRVAAWLKVSQDHAADYRFERKNQPDVPLKLLPKAVFRHSQPVRGDDIGAVYLWVDDTGRPAVIGTVFSYSQGGPGERWVAHEFHSLSTTPLIGKWRNAAAWSPSEPGLNWKEVPDAPAPAESANVRLRQMRDIGRRLTAQSTDANNSHWELRLIPQPIYQYTVEKSADKNSGAVFLFCQGTDPEIVLLLEARKGMNQTTWHYALAPFTDYDLSVKLDAKAVWTLKRNQRPTRDAAHWWDGKMEVKQLSAEEEAELAKMSTVAPEAK